MEEHEQTLREIAVMMGRDPDDWEKLMQQILYYKENDLEMYEVVKKVIATQQGIKEMRNLIAEGKRNQNFELPSEPQTKSIKKIRISDKLSFETVRKGDSFSEYAEDMDADEDGGIIHKKSNKWNLFDCGCIASKETFGHAADGCGHTACKQHVKEWYLICAKKMCMQKLCPKDGCTRHVINNMNLCKKHAREININAWLGLVGLEDPNVICRRKRE